MLRFNMKFKHAKLFVTVGANLTIKRRAKKRGRKSNRSSRKIKTQPVKVLTAWDKIRDSLLEIDEIKN